MIPSHLSLVPFSPERRAAMVAIAEVERRRSRGAVFTAYPYASAFFRTLNGSKRITVKDIAWFSPGLTAQTLRGKKHEWLAAIDRLIESRGTCCWLPLSLSDGWRLFPETKFQVSERRRRQSELSAEKYTRQRRKEQCQRERAYQALAGQAEIELAFHTPETVSSWIARWSGTELRQYDLEDMFWRWSERFPSLASIERQEWQDIPFWRVILETGIAVKETGYVIREMERWMVPNKLRKMA
ncbi:plasmid SOS inhibition protein A [Escherichia coli]|uniref:plasmid SOS inhibition protein A n=1 Tax=Citrobacter portucalensis TaxID=1639133 RepID=UPI00158059CA|nr:plasmid SOS inhibition protein A [Citrobacter portucalensis]EFC1481146.1 plasmid SOS inhibition protein A [Escherichia coli]EFE8233898.1 plasmid SOS inhibition protein A [Escherichia coli]NUH52247.1 plasmid SOS inhibition protein A [Citrobacter portucalensis]